MTRQLFSVCLVALAVGCQKPPPAPESRPAPIAVKPASVKSDERPPHGEGSIRGVVQFTGAIPAPRPIDLSSWGKECKPLMTETNVHDVVVGENSGLKQAFIYVRSGLPPTAKYEIPDEPVAVTNKGCWFDPRVTVVRRGQKFEMRNDDNILHSFHSYELSGDQSDNINAKGQIITRTFKDSQVFVVLFCDIHPWMNSHVAVLDHPFFANTAADGSFEIAKLPEGDYTVEILHPYLGRKTESVKLAAGSMSKEIKVSFGDDDLPAPGMRKVLERSEGNLGWK